MLTIPPRFYLGYHHPSDYATAIGRSSYPVVENERRNYFEILADGTALLEHVEVTTRIKLRIWRYDSATDKMLVVLEG